MTNRRHLFLAPALLALAAPALAHDTVTELGALRIVNPWTRAAGQGMQGGGFLVIRNTGATPDRLVSASSPAAGRMELHTHVRDGDVMRMRPVNDIPVPANGEVTLQPGGLHLMLIGLTQALNAGQTIPVTLRFERAGEVTIQLAVQAAGARQPAHRH
ncbi:copper chaperone PCu(A)C [Roseococcus sp. SDR]|uniref:copper chaperone PCu(A)C n=1 Tax=Roseococcus sp. SDR TaxID=2835532 RepID=UPI001BCC665C|nr:copper chaperone PCu(A)C [Roseococcus sp. SDR]MBS7789532.1 copper chaperone PCu(A)C [Roseococcus sp. SDR]MBV1844846.1 copper chaperone PCu(A)C [Roseococcus sp. SDR]